MLNRSSDRNLLFGILALQLDFISRDALIEAMNAWVLDKSRPLGDILCDQSKLTSERQQLLDALVGQHLKQHDNDTEKSLRSLSSIESVRDDLNRLRDKDLEQSLVHVSAAQRADDPHATQPFTVGQSTSVASRFRVLRPHAKGGLGQVSVALDEELNREVALKELQEHYADDPHCRSRFSMEAEITGSLEHPGVVPVYGLGQYCDGRPYYAMRFIRGDSLKDAIDRFHAKDSAPDGKAAGLSGEPPSVQSGLGWRDDGERTLEFRKLLGRFIDVCNAVEYAHSRGVLHRDLKPGNIMLGNYGETLVVDWGLAKPVGRPESHRASAEATLMPATGSGSAPTRTGAAIGTPAYMSPEQAAGRLDELGPASDVYSLGATLYTLLTGQAPFRDSDLGSTLRKVQNGKFTPPRQIKPATAPPLEAICLKGMARDAARRYQSPRELAEDMEQWLANEPVSAYPEPLVTRLRRWVRRHETLVAVAAAAVLVAGVGLSIHTRVISERNRKLEEANRQTTDAMVDAQLAREDAEQHRSRAEAAATEARTEAARAVAVSGFLQGMFEAGDPVGMKGWKFGLTSKSRQNLTAREILEQGEASVREQLKDQPLVQASLLNAIGSCYFNLAMKDKAAPLLEEALELRRQFLSEDHPDFADSVLSVGWLRHELGDYGEAERFYRDALELRRRNLGDDDLTVADTMFFLAWLLADSGGFDESEALFRRVIQVRTDRLGRDHRQVAVALVGLAGLFIQKGDDDSQILPIIQQAQQIFLKQPGDRTFADATVAFQMGIMQDRMFNNLDGAEQQFRKARELAILALGDEHPYVAFGTHELASVLRKKKQYDEAEKLLREILATCERVLPRDHPKMVLVLDGLAMTVELKGDLLAAKALYAEGVRLQESWLAAHPNTLTAQLRLSDLYRSLTKVCRRLNQPDEAKRHCQRSIEISSALADSDPNDLLVQESLGDSYSLLGDVHLMMYQADDANASYLRTLRIYTAISEAKPKDRDALADLGQSYSDLARVAFQVGQLSAALGYCRRELRIMTKLLESRPNDSLAKNNLAIAHDRLGDIAIQLGHSDQAIESYQRALIQYSQLADLDRADTSYQRNLARCQNRLALAAQENQQFEQAAEWYSKELHIIEQLEAADRLSGGESAWSGAVRNRLAVCQNAQTDVLDLDSALSRSRAEAVGLLKVRAAVLAETSDHAGALATAEKLRDLSSNKPRNLYDAACCLCLCSRAGLRSRLRSTSLPADDKYDDAALTESDRAAQVRYRVEAIRCLDAAVNAGWTNLSAFTDPELVPIRQHPAYDEIAERLRSAARLDTGASESGSQ